MKKIVFILLVMGLVLLISCKEQPKDSSSEKLQEKQNLSIEKYNAYVEVNNFMNERFNEVLAYYYKGFGLDMDTYSTNVGSVVISSVSETELDMVLKNLQVYTKEPVIKDLDAAAKDLEPTMVELSHILNDAEFYYDSKNYVDDHFEEGKKLHTQICTSYEEYEKKKERFIKAMRELCYTQTQKDMEKYIKNKEHIKYYSISYMLIAVDMFDELQKQNISDENMMNIDQEKFAEQYNHLSKEIDKLMEAVNNSSSHEKTQFEPYNFKDFIDYAQKTKAAAADLLNSLNKKDSSLGSPEEFYSNLRTMISYYNRVVYFSDEVKNLNYFPTR
ncbi:DUF3829 domain-containing protein [Inediibacterium massiliense]|uniref:DUF3829 domain-containing protein n=1 Tax=Inediibacterium massiliense TaxID=1658111 RepID=UPI0006B44410|nr:DUF3829 domain-containing protein [Inediibacterium massiliense]